MDTMRPTTGEGGGLGVRVVTGQVRAGCDSMGPLQAEGSLQGVSTSAPLPSDIRRRMSE